jgi:type I restriction enzyme S subunit
MATSVPFRAVVADAIGGGWGQEAPFSDSIPVAVIRGTDFDDVRYSSFAKVPRRHEARRKASRRQLRVNDILLEVSGGSPTSGQTTGRSLLVTERMIEALGGSVIPASFCRRVRIDEQRADPRYAYYALQDMYSSGRAADYEHQSTGISNFQFEFFLDQEQIGLPSVPDQRAIAGVLGALDDRIVLNRRMNETLEAIARALFKSWFVDFDPVRAKADSRDPRLPPHLVDLFPDSFEESELGNIPRGWRVAPIGDLAHVVGGSTPRTSEPSFWTNGRHSWATPRDLARLATPVLLGTERRITDAGLAQIGSGLLPKGTVLLSSRAPIGYLTVADLPVAINQGFIAMRPKPGVSNLFLLRWAESALDEIVSRANGSTFLEVSKSSFRQIPVVVPSPETSDAFDQAVQPIHSRLVASELENQALASLRDTVLPRLISGLVPATGPIA